MSEETELVSDTFHTELRQLQKPTLLDSIMESVEILIHKSSSMEPKKIIIKKFSSFFTIQDILVLIWLEENKSPEWHPSYVFLGVRDGDTFTNANGHWYSNIEEPVKLPDPFETMKTNSQLDEFVTAKGDSLPVRFAPRLRVTVEDAFSKTVRFHAYSLRACLRVFTGIQPLSEASWNGSFKPYFPIASSDGPYEATIEQINDIQPFEIVIKAKQKQLNFLSTLMDEQEISPPKTTGIYSISYIWSKRPTFDGCDITFYSYASTPTCPFVRYIPWNGATMTKLYRKDALSKPYVNDPVILRQWSTEKTGNDEKDSLIIKVALRDPQPAIPGLYGSLHLLEDGTATFTLIPPKGVRSLGVTSDLNFLGTILNTTVKGLPINIDDARLHRAIIHVGFNMDRSVKHLTLTAIRQRLKKISTYFQELPIPKNEKMSMLLRYKNVSNFVRQDRISIFLTFLSEKISLIGLQPPQEFVVEVAREFSLSIDEATRHVADWFQGRSEFTLANPTTEDYISEENPGTDIAVYDQYPFYSFHIYSVQSVKDFQRICTLLSLLWLTSSEYWTNNEKEEAVINSAEELIQPLNTDKSPVLEDDEKPAVFEEEDLDFLAATGFDEGILDELPEDLPARVESGKLPVVSAAIEKDSNEESESDEEIVAKPLGKAAPIIKQKKSDKEKPIVAFSFFIDKLKELDPTLFAYKKPPTGVKHYTSNCAANWDRQPLVLTKQEFNDLENIYADDEDLSFIIYGESDWASKKRDAQKKGNEIVYLMKYGSEPSNPNYYLCCEFFCIRDRLMIRQKDWFSKKDREGKVKEAESCPFCHGKELPIKKRKTPGQDQVVLRRIIKPNTDPKEEKRHIYINFLKDAKHPDGFDLPCCFTSSKDIDYNHPAFKKMHSAFSLPKAKNEEDEEDELPSTKKQLKSEEKKKATGAVVDYGVIQYKLGKDYILGAEKYPLDPGKGGVCATSLDKYFGQDSAQLVARTAIKQEIKPTSQGFFRLGSLNTPQEIENSLFSALAPYLQLNTSDQVADLFHTKISPRVFLQLNFGNLLLEFFDPSIKEEPDRKLQEFASKHLQSDIKDIKFEISRFKRSYDNFQKNYVLNTNKQKYMRHIAHALAEPGLITEHGLLLITLEYDRDPRDPNVQVNVQCPASGLDADRYSQNDIGFISHYISKDGSSIWEPIIFIKRNNHTEGPPYNQEGKFIMTRVDISSSNFPEIARTRINEYMSQCSSAYRGIYTAQKNVDSRFLIPISKALTIFDTSEIKSHSILRDSYNHLVAITVKGDTSDEIIIPISDDGSLSHDNTGLHVYLSFNSIKLANADTVNKMYSDILTPLLKPYSSIYSISHFLQYKRDIYGFILGGPRTGATIALPCSDGEVPAEQIVNIETKAPFEFEINKDLSKPDIKKTKYESVYLLKKDQAEEIYQTLRLIFANWLGSDRAGSDLRDRIELLLERNDVPVYEKRKRLQIELGPTIDSWLLKDSDPYRVEPQILRKDCIQIMDAGECSGHCSWVSSDQKCYLHSPEEIQVSSTKETEAVRFFSLRLFDELIRIPKRRQEIMMKQISRIQTPSTNIQIGDQWIIPEKSLAWYDLLRPAVSEKGKEEARYYEEFTSKDLDKEELPLEYYSDETIMSLLDPEVATKSILRKIGDRDSETPLQDLLTYLRIPSEILTIDDEDEKPIFTPVQTLALSKYFELKPIVQILSKSDPPDIYTRVQGIRGKQGPAIVFIPDARKGPSLLIPKDTLSDVIPLPLLKGRIQDAILTSKPRITKA